MKTWNRALEVLVSSTWRILSVWLSESGPHISGPLPKFPVVVISTCQNSKKSSRPNNFVFLLDWPKFGVWQWDLIWSNNWFQQRNHQCFIAMWPLMPSANCVRIGWPDPWNLAWGAAGSKSEGVELGSRNAQCLLSPLRYAKLLQDIQAPIRGWVLQMVWTLKKLKGRWLAARETNSWYSATHRCTTPI
jgi:hypothetical protein